MNVYILPEALVPFTFSIFLFHSFFLFFFFIQSLNLASGRTRKSNAKKASFRAGIPRSASRRSSSAMMSPTATTPQTKLIAVSSKISPTFPFRLFLDKIIDNDDCIFTLRARGSVKHNISGYHSFSIDFPLLH